mgnify:FL=1
MTSLRAELFSVLLAAACSGFAADRTWDGLGTADSNWSTAENWGGTAPASGDALFFGGSLRLSNSNDLGEGFSVGGVTFNAGAGAFTLGGDGVALDGDVLNRDNDTQTLNLPVVLSALRTFHATNGAILVNGPITGAGGLDKKGAYPLTLAGSNAYEGVTTVYTNGRVIITHANALGGSAQGTVVNPAGILEIQNGLTVAEPLTLVNYNPGSLYFTSGSNTYSGLITITGGQARISNTGPYAHIIGGITSVNSEVILAGSSALRIGEKPILAGARKLFSHNSGTTIFGVAGNVFATFEAAGGAVQMEVPNAWPATLRLEVGVTYARNSRIDLQGNDQTVGTLVSPVTNDGVRVIASTTGPATLTVNQGGDTEYNGGFGGELRLVKLGAGQLTVSGTNCFQNAQTVVGGGKLRILSEKTLGLVPESFVADRLVISNGASLLATGPCVLDDATRGITLGSGNGGFETAAGADMVVSNAITGAGGLTKAGAGTLTLAGANDYAGKTTVSAGTLQAGQKVSLYNGAPLSADNFTVNSGATLLLNVGGAGEFTSGDVSAIAALGTATTGFKPGSWLALTATNAPGGSYEVSDLIGNPSGGQGLNLDKLGAGTLALTGLNSYTGATRISQGVLSVTNIADGGVASGLGQSSKLKENLIFAGGTLRYTGPTARTDRGFKYAVNTNVYAFEVVQADAVLTFGSISNATFDSSATVIRKTGPGTLAFGKSFPAGSNGNYPVRSIHLLAGKMKFDDSGNNTVQQNLYCVASNGPALLLGDGVELLYNTPLERGNDRLVQYIGTQTCARLAAAALTLCGPDVYPANSHTFDVNEGADDVDLLVAAKLDVFPSATAISDLIKAGRGTLKLAHAQNAYRGRTVIRGGRLLIGANVTSNVAGPLGASTNVIQFGDALSQPADAPSLLFDGTNNSAFACNRSVSVYPAGAAAAIGSLSNNNVTFNGAITVSNTLQLLSAATGTNALFITGGISGPGGVTLAGTGTVRLVAANTYTGATTVAAGTLQLVASERIDNASPLRLTGGLVDARGFSETLGVLDVDGPAAIDFGTGGALAFADSAAQAWSGTLLLRNWQRDSDHLFVGSTACLTEAQLNKITSPSGQTAAQLSTGEVVLLPLGTRFLLR